MVRQITFLDEHRVQVGDTCFHCEYPLPTDIGSCLPVTKDPAMLAAYEALCRSLEPRRIVELGIRFGGSTALLHELAEPDTLVAVELAPDPAPALTDFITARQLQNVIRPHYGVDQADRARLRSIVADAVGDEPLDLVIDDASHLYLESLASFETLFPLLRPGGVYVIEDWATGHRGLHVVAQAMAHASPEQLAALGALLRDAEAGTATTGPVPLARLTHELVLARTMGEDVVESMEVTKHWTIARRGAAALDPDTFRLRDHYHDFFGFAGPDPDPTPAPG